MSESIKLIYKILKILENSMDYSVLDVDRLSPEALGTSLAFRGSEISPSENYISDKCLVTVNPDTGILIQTNLNKKKKVK